MSKRVIGDVTVRIQILWISEIIDAAGVHETTESRIRRIGRQTRNPVRRSREKEVEIFANKLPPHRILISGIHVVVIRGAVVFLAGKFALLGVASPGASARRRSSL